MNLNKKVVQSMTVASTLLAITTVTVLGGSTEDTIGKAAAPVAIGKYGTAGIVFDLSEKNLNILRSNTNFAASIERPQRDIVAKQTEASVDTADTKDSENTLIAGRPQELETKEPAVSVGGAAELKEFAAETVTQSIEVALGELDGENSAEEVRKTDTEENPVAETMEGQTLGEAPAEEIADETPAKDVKVPEEQPQEESEWTNRVMANVEEDMNIRTAPDENSELAGKFYRGDVAEIISVEGDWTQITSGNATGYVKNEYLVYGNDANALANEVCSLYATVNTDGLRLRSEPSEEAGIVTTAGNGDKLKVNKEAVAADGWVPVHTTDSTAYVSADYVEVALNLGSALTSEEVAAKEAEEAKAKEKEAGKKPAANANSDEVTLLGALIQCEAGSGSYEGMVAVGAVVMNRVRSGGYPSSISGVIYQSGQFTPALSGAVANVAASGVRSACLQAAREAINGTDNTNGALSFRSAASGHSGTIIGANVFF